MSELIKLTIELILDISYLSYFIPLVFLILLRKNNKSKSLKVIFLYICYSVFIIALQYYIREARLGKELFYIVIRLHFFIEFTILAYFFQSIFRNPKIKKVTLALILLFLLYSGYDYWVGSKESFGANPAIVESLFIMMILLYYFFEKIRYEVQIPLYESKIFWIATGLLVFFSGNFFLLIYSKTMIEDTHFQETYKTIYNSFNIIKNILLSIALFIKETNIPLTNNNNPFDMLDENSYPFNKQN